MRSRPLLLLATCFASMTAFAQVSQARPKLAVLGLEVVGENAMDAKATEAAKSLTRELRREASRPNGAFELAPNSNKDLLEMKLLSDCSDEGRRCMSEIGKQLKADRLLYGKLERVRRGYSLSLRVLDTEKGEIVKQLGEVIPLGDIATSAGLQARARALYGRLTGSEEEGSLSITASAERGSVYVDGKLRTSLSAGSARVSGLGQGVHVVAIESPGFERFEAEVSIDSGETRNLRADLIEGGGDGDGGVEAGVDRPGRGWRVAFWSGVVAAGVAGAGWTYSGLTVLSEEDKKDEGTEAYGGPALKGLVENPDGSKYYRDACESFANENKPSGLRTEDADAFRKVRSACVRGNTHKNLVNLVWMPATAAAVLFAGFAFYKGYIAPPGRYSVEQEARRRKRFRSRITVAPALGPNLIGAGLELQF